MVNSDSKKKTIIKLPVQTLNLDNIKKLNRLRKIILQFEVSLEDAADSMFALVAYPVYRGKKKYKIGKALPLEVEKGEITIELPLPLTLGNLELSYSQIKSLRKSGKGPLKFKPYLYEKNAHAAYYVTDNIGQVTEEANPTPPGRPSI